MSSRGLSLIETLISLFLSSFIISILVNQYLMIHTHYDHMGKKIDESFDVQFIINIIRDRVKRAGFTPCSNIDFLVSLDHRGKTDSLKSIRVSSEPLPMLTIHRMSNNFIEDAEILTPTQILVPSTYLLKNRLVMIADCHHAELQKIISTEHRGKKQLLTLADPLAFKYQGLYLGDWLEESFFMQAKRKDTLFYKSGKAEQLSNIIKNIAFSLHQKDNHRWLQITLLLTHESQSFITTIRN